MTDDTVIARAAAVLERVTPILEALKAWRDARDAFDDAGDDDHPPRHQHGGVENSTYTRMQALAEAEGKLMALARELK
jgi:hypothetical protein